IELVKYGKSRRARLFYLRDLVGSKITRVKEDLQKNIEEAARRSALRKEQDKQREQAKLAEKAAKEAEEKAAAKAKKEAEAKEAEEKKKAAETKKAEETKTETPPDTPTA
ncbi:MAG: 50S ribosomal protein L19, partial [Firmicutes bacterium]|nr:50S ribosomal protein L19 [Bacillota bacterium]